MLSDNIREYRKKNNMSQDELAEKLGVSRQSVSLWETGQTQPTIENIISLAKIFNVSTDAILGNIPDENKKQDEPAKLDETKSGNHAVIIAVAAVLLIFAIMIALFIGKAMKKNKDTVTDTVTQTDTENDYENITTAVEIPEESVSGDNETESDAADISIVIEDTTIPETVSVPETTVPETKPQETTPAETKPQETTPAETKPPKTTTASVTTEPAETFDLFEYCKEVALKKGTVNGVYSMYQQPSTLYGGYDNEYFSISYWTDSDKVEFCLHCPLSDTLSINFYLCMRGGYDHTYEYSSSKYYRSSGDSLRFVMGYIDPSAFSASYPLSYKDYIGSTDGMDEFLEESRVGICDLIKLIKNFVRVENLDCGFSAFEFKNF